MVELAVALQGAGHQITLCVPGGGQLEAEAERRELRIAELPGLSLTHRRSLLWNLGRLLKATAVYGGVLRQSRPDLVVANSLQAAILCSLVPLWRRRTPIIWHYRYDFPVTRGNRLLVASGALRMRRLVLIAPGMRWGAQALGVPDRKLVVIRNAVDLTSFSPLSAAQRAAVRARYGVTDPSTKVMVSVGQICERKNQADAVRGLARVKALGMGARLWLLGSPLDEDGARYEVSLRGLAKELGLESDVLFAGQTDDVPAVLAAADVLLHTAQSEAFGRVLVEAMACELPVIASDTVGAREIIVPGVTGYVFPNGDLDALASSLSAVLRNGQLAASMGRAGWLRAHEEFSIQRLTSEFTSVLSDLDP